MKRTICIISCISLLMFTGCGSTVPGSRVTIGTTGVKDVIQSEMAAESSTSSAAEESMLSVPDEEKDQYYYSCIIKDALACCSQGLSHGGSSLFLIRQDQYIVTPQQIRDIICI